MRPFWRILVGSKSRHKSAISALAVCNPTQTGLPQTGQIAKNDEFDPCDYPCPGSPQVHCGDPGPGPVMCLPDLRDTGAARVKFVIFDDLTRRRIRHDFVDFDLAAHVFRKVVDEFTGRQPGTVDGQGYCASAVSHLEQPAEIDKTATQTRQAGPLALQGQGPGQADPWEPACPGLCRPLRYMCTARSTRRRRGHKSDEKSLLRDHREVILMVVTQSEFCKFNRIYDKSTRRFRRVGRQ